MFPLLIKPAFVLELETRSILCLMQGEGRKSLMLFSLECNGLYSFPITSVSFLFVALQFIMSLDIQITKEAFQEVRRSEFKDVFNKKPAKPSLERQGLTELEQ